jgi:chemotaxis protein MotB
MTTTALLSKIRVLVLWSIASVGVLLLHSCVSAAKFDEAESARALQQQRADSLERLTRQLMRSVAKLDAAVAECAADTAQLHRQLEQQAVQTDSLNRLSADLLDRYTSLLGNYNQLKSTSAKETQKLLASLEKSQQEVNERSKEQRLNEEKLRQRDSVLARLQRDVQMREQRLREVEQKLQARDAALQALRTKIAEALVGVKDGDLSIEARGGKIYVSLSNRLLFASGSTQIESAGKQALKQLAAALNRQPDINIIVEGHTDDAKVTNLGALKDNWDLSVMRATEVIRFLTQEGNLDPKRITAAGRGEFAPVEAGSTPQIRAKNRRTEIILTPKLDELFEILRNQ